LRRQCFFYLVSLVYCFVAVATEGQSLPQQGQNGRDENGSKASGTAATDPLGRNTPKGTVAGFLESASNGRYEEAAQYLQMSQEARTQRGDSIARQLYFLMESAFVERVGIISNRLEGGHQIGVPKDRQRIGVFRINGSDINVDLVHVPDPVSGEIWLFSSQLVATVPDLFAAVESGEAVVGRSHLQVIRRFLNTGLRRLLALLLLVPVSWAVGGMAVYLILLIARLFARWRHGRFAGEVLQSLTAPMTLLLGMVFFQVGVFFLGLSVLTRLNHQRFTGVVLVLGLAWLVFRLINVWSDQARARTLDSSDYKRGSIILLGQRIAKVVAVIVAGLLTLSILGLDVTTAIAGLGITSIALAFAAQKTLENLLGGVSILGDEVIRIGEVCRIGDREGTVEDISLRSTRFRTLAGTMLSVPNGQLAGMNLENLSRRDQTLFNATIELRYETTPDQLRSLLAAIISLLREHPKVGTKALRVRLVGFSETGLKVEVNGQILTGSFEEFMAIREQLLLRIMELVSDAGTGFAIPPRLLYTPERGRGESLPETHDVSRRLRYGGF
jgi:MscS family membrane protein